MSLGRTFVMRRRSRLRYSFGGEGHRLGIWKNYRSADCVVGGFPYNEVKPPKPGAPAA